MLATRTPDAIASDPIATLITAGDYRAALTQCVRVHGPALGRLCMAFLGVQSEAEEAAQEALMAALDAMPSYRREGSVRAWLFAIARRICGRKLETRVRREQRLRLVQLDESAEGADTLLVARERATRVRLALDQLKPTEREALVLRYESELSFAEVAHSCGIDEAAARKRVSRGLERLRRALGDE
ncbi:MAG: sigma-70 family RNA polymerase sigma factor [Deltaproteobacteria bacterium]|nr:sigma-70 family RNA polymerase sigma factor [Deltaproteobacteria bacterium]